ncbi:hypothetical protein [Halopelagius longus]|uniref:Uncharacterized protein n=1 Tax=Halopelagius longus TaxID=1236180 RepID=A0A1H1BVY9_9EURY|nr:hypothetical protein [Halopelagius longus]RDI70950.1 hypothetical protein DWB78_03965 [Halopelagius longus]SDQ56098.1 hypothetical protein SAMN05216278_1983 [Halopelagius longus]
MSGSILGRIDVMELLSDVDYEEALEGTQWEGVTEEDGLGERLGARAGEWLGGALGALFGEVAGDMLVGEMLDKVGGDAQLSGSGDGGSDSTQEANA